PDPDAESDEAAGEAPVGEGAVVEALGRACEAAAAGKARAHPGGRGARAARARGTASSAGLARIGIVRHRDVEEHRGHTEKNSSQAHALILGRIFSRGAPVKNGGFQPWGVTLGMAHRMEG